MNVLSQPPSYILLFILIFLETEMAGTITFLLHIKQRELDQSYTALYLAPPYCPNLDKPVPTCPPVIPRNTFYQKEK